jgi:cytohesin
MSILLDSGISMEGVMDFLLSPDVEEAKSRLSEEERKVLAEIRAEKELVIEEIKELQETIAETDRDIEFMIEATAERDSSSADVVKRRSASSLFNENPEKGVKMLVNKKIVKETPEDVAHFLKTEAALKKKAIGDYIGEMDEFNVDTLKAFVRLHDFAGHTLVDALRDFLRSFHLPGEAQKIDRIVECFAAHFCDCNPAVFANPDTCYVLTYSVILLHTNLHNPNVKNKDTPEMFVRMNRGIDDGKDLPREMLLDLYASIKREKFQVPDEDQFAEMFFNPEREGWLTKEGGTHQTKHKRWFILKGSVLYYFKSMSARVSVNCAPVTAVW